jgi:hypothetical protein
MPNDSARPTDEPFIRLTDLAKQLHTSAISLRKQAREGRLEIIRLSERKFVVRRGELERYLRANCMAPAAQ